MNMQLSVIQTLEDEKKKFTQEGDAYLRKRYPTLFPAEKNLSNFGHNDAIDAFRHAYVSGRFAQEYGPNSSFLMGAYHERAHLNEGPERHMDFWNNAKGIEYAQTAKTPEALADRIDKGIKRGELITAPGQTPTVQTSYPDESSAQSPQQQNKARLRR
ncbi:DUF6973 domain-containing protein [Herbaspirillum seropedicae]|uniref:DUF6973 domain-containing protein n=1 Tax=Herbaspirillum seropedicae TaxID=964 RepID=UPI003FCEA919